jgi:hypothetical protein
VRNHFELHHLRRRRSGRCNPLRCGRCTTGVAAATAAARRADRNVERPKNDGTRFDHRCGRAGSNHSRGLRSFRLAGLSWLSFGQRFVSRDANRGEDLSEEISRQTIECRTKAFHHSGAYRIERSTSRAHREIGINEASSLSLTRIHQAPRLFEVAEKFHCRAWIAAARGGISSRVSEIAAQT